jgi:prevent-host-death family protein
MKQIAAAKFKAQCLGILDRLGPEGVVITKHGKPVARLTPFERGAEGLIGCLRGRIRILGDLGSTGIEWETGAES